ncbi:MAG: glycosyltransferase family 4 protein [Deltaproteobacteria bacterium]|nr:glycosyltransferase family 4 protein [Deltaproteobacteria bacterium]
MKVLMLSANLDLPEANLTAALPELGANVTLVVEQNSPYQDVLRGFTGRVLHHTFPSRFNLGSIRWLRSLCKKEKVDIVHCFSNRALSNAVLAAIGTRIKIVAYRGTVGHVSRLDPSSWFAYLNPKVSKIVCVSEAVKKYLAGKGVDDGRLVRIYKGHDPKWYDGIMALPVEKFAIPEGSFTVCCTANMRYVKGVDVLIESMRFIPPESNVHLLLVGDVRDSAVHTTRQSSSMRERIHFTGFRHDAVAIMKGTDAFCMPSRYREGLPKSVLEAMACSLPVVATNVGGLPEVVQNNKNGFIVNPDDPAALAAAICKLSADRALAKRLGETGRRILSERFSFDATLSQTFSLYRELLASQ